MRDDTLIVFESDNGGPRSAAVTGEVDMSNSTIPADNGSFRDGKGSLYEGGTRVVALANWPGKIAPGTVVDSPMHIVDMFPTLVGLAGGTTAGGKPLDGLDMWPTIAHGAPSPRTEVVYDVEPFRAAVRQGNWKLVWRVVLPSKIELFDLATDPGETKNVADQHPDIVTQLMQRADVLAQGSVPPLLLQDGVGAVRQVLMGSVALPGDDELIDAQP
ncbi:MAG TPA: sulfatase-like hydrolase/transferase, partial [Pseudomonadales bacterium]|nr:sulfatase-like hydrolase/transferase [Pseudomonadales bacterium]